MTVTNNPHNRTSADDDSAHVLQVVNPLVDLLTLQTLQHTFSGGLFPRHVGKYLGALHFAFRRNHKVVLFWPQEASSGVRCDLTITPHSAGLMCDAIYLGRRLPCADERSPRLSPR